MAGRSYGKKDEIVSALICFGPQIWAGNSNGEIVAFDVADGSTVRRWAAHTAMVTDMCLSTGGAWSTGAALCQMSFHSKGDRLQQAGTGF